MKGVSWFQNSVIYQVFIDRFEGADPKKAKKPVFAGGNIRGIIKRLDYIKQLGIDTIWISPFYRTSAYHGYHITDFFKPEPRFGTLADVKRLIAEVHRRGMRIIADFVPNHCSWKHPYFLDAQKRKDSRYRDWFYFRRWPDRYMCFLSCKELPKLNLDNPEAKAHIMKAAKYWLSIGFDGYRLDHVIGPKHEFWQEFRQEIKKEFPDAVLIGEAWGLGIRFTELETVNVRNKYWKWLGRGVSETLMKEYVGELDGVLDFRFQELINKYMAKPGKPKIAALKRALDRHFSGYPKDFFLVTFLDNHDMDRFLFQCRQDKERLMEAAKIQFSLDRPTIIYYGTEVGMTQKTSMKKLKKHGDLQARQPMLWEKQDKTLLDFYKRLIKTRSK